MRLDFLDLPRSEADKHCRWVKETERDFLILLALWMRDSGGPIDRIDGTFASLVDLWVWYLSFIDDDCPGVDRAVKPPPVVNDDLYAFNPTIDPEVVSRRVALYVGQALMRYQRPMFAALDPDAHWAVFAPRRIRGRLVEGFHETGVSFGKGNFALLGASIRGLTHSHWDGRPGVNEPNRLLQAATVRFIPKNAEILANRRESLLLPLLKGAETAAPPPPSPLTPSSWIVD